MALQKSHENDAGNSGDHWEIVSIHMDIKGNAMDVRLELFKDEAAYSSGKSSMGISKNITISPLPSTMDGILNTIFAQMKSKLMSDQDLGAIPFFNGATTV